MERFRTEYAPLKSRPRSLRNFGYWRNQSAYQENRLRRNEYQYTKKYKQKALESLDNLTLLSKSKDFESQRLELEGHKNTWHSGELILFVKLHNDRTSDYLINSPLGTSFNGEGLWGIGFDLGVRRDKRNIIIAESWGLLYFCDLLLYYFEKELIFQNNSYYEEERTSSKNRIELDIIYFEKDMKDAYAFGWDLVDQLSEVSRHRVKLKSRLFHVVNEISEGDPDFNRKQPIYE